MSETSIHERMTRQHGLITREQALQEGMTDTQIKWRIRTGSWVRVARGVYRHRSTPDTRMARLLAACLTRDALASHRSAAALHGIDGFRLDYIELVVPRGGAKSLTGAILHQSTQFDLVMPTERRGIPCTGLGRTLLDVSAVVSRQRLDQAIDSVLRDGWLRLPDLYRILVSHARRGRDGCAAFRASLEDRSDDSIPLSLNPPVGWCGWWLWDWLAAGWWFGSGQAAFGCVGARQVRGLGLWRVGGAGVCAGARRAPGRVLR